MKSPTPPPPNSQRTLAKNAKEAQWDGIPLDLTGRRFGKLTAISLAASQRRIHWTCRCDCGSELEARSSHLTSGHTKSCGCLRKTHFTFEDGTVKSLDDIAKDCGLKRATVHARYRRNNSISYDDLTAPSRKQ